MTTGIMYSIIFFQFPMRIISGRSNFLKAVLHFASLNIQKITQQCVRLFYSLPYPPRWTVGGCELGWKIRRVLFRLIRIPRTVAEWRLQIFAISIWGYGGDWLCCRVRHTHPLLTFSKVMWRFLICSENFKTHTPVYIWVPPWCTVLPLLVLPLLIYIWHSGTTKAD